MNQSVKEHVALSPIKETDRIAALQNELEKVNAKFNYQQEKSKNQGKDFFEVTGKVQINQPKFETYEDHRMAMAFAPLAMFGPIQVHEPMVVVKSYPNFWKDINDIGFDINSEKN